MSKAFKTNTATAAMLTYLYTPKEKQLPVTLNQHQKILLARKTPKIQQNCASLHVT